MTINLLTGKTLPMVAEVVVLPVLKNTVSDQPLLKQFDAMIPGGLLAWLARADFTGRHGEFETLALPGSNGLKRLVCCGLGEAKDLTVDRLQMAAGKIIRNAKELKASELMIAVDDIPDGDLPLRFVAQAFVEGLLLANYQFHGYKAEKTTDDDQKSKRSLEKIHLWEPSARRSKHWQRGIDDAETVSRGVMLARDLVNTPPNDMLPADLLQAAKTIVAEDKSKRLRVEVLDAKAMEKLGMRAALGVAQGSDQPAVGVHLIYTSRGATNKTKKIALVGKAVTFDSGGLSLKPADQMTTMKMDMAGAAAVLGTFAALPKLDINAEVHGIFLAVENMPSGRAYRPGDVVKAMNGTTIEVLNTDAEGRVTLADALSYAASLKPAAMIDVATLTGACMVALGDDIAGLMANDRRLAERVLDAGRQTAEHLWELPLFPSYQESIKSKVADVKNIGGRMGGAITAGLFLSHFVNDIPWVHLDIAGPAFAEHDQRADVPYGGTGFGVRLLIRYLQGLR